MTWRVGEADVRAPRTFLANQMIIFTLIFWSSLFSIFWTYFGYYAFLKLLSMFVTDNSQEHQFTPELTIVITVHNEARNIKQKIDNCLASDYPEDKLEIVVVSDGSTDDTDTIVSALAHNSVRLLPFSKRHGKDFCQGKGVEAASGEIVILTDATTLFERDAIKHLVSSFADSNVATVSGVDEIIETEKGQSGEGAYVRYEMNLRKLESQIDSMIVVSGNLFAVRKELCQPWHSDLTSDFYLPVMARMKGLQNKIENRAKGYYGATDDPQKEFNRKVRTIVNGLRVLLRFRRILNPFKYGLYSFQMFSHKLMRWLVPFCLILVVVSNIALLRCGYVYVIIMFGQVLFYFSALLACVIGSLRSFFCFRIPLFFLIVNLAALKAWCDLILGRKHAVWGPTDR